MKTKLAALALAVLALPSYAGEQTRFYSPDGRSVGTATRTSDGTTRYHDARGRSTGTSTTSGGAMTVYDSRGRVIGRANSQEPPGITTRSAAMQAFWVR